MKKLFILFAFLLSSNKILLAQVRTATFKDGKTMNFEILKEDPYLINKINTAFFLNISDMTTFNVSASYLQPGQYLGKVNAGYGLLGGEFTYYLQSKEKSKEGKVVISEEVEENQMHVRRVIKVPIKKLISWGGHVGYTYKDYSKGVFNSETAGYSAQELAIGLSASSVECSKISVEKKDSKYITHRAYQYSVYADLLFYPVRTLENSKSTVDDISSSTGYRLFFETRTSTIGSQTLGYFFQLGIQRSQKQFFLIFSPGIYLSF